LFPAFSPLPSVHWLAALKKEMISLKELGFSQESAQVTVISLITFCSFGFVNGVTFAEKLAKSSIFSQPGKGHAPFPSFSKNSLPGIQ